MEPLVGFSHAGAVAWTIAGSDPSGGAGLQADLKTFANHAVHGCSIVAALTAQNTQGVAAVEKVTPTFVASQWRALAKDLPPGAIKTGMLGDAGIVRTLAQLFEETTVPLVCDPVLFSSSGHVLLDPEGAHQLKTRLLPRATLVTPNLHEAVWLAGHNIATRTDVEAAARKILALGPQAVLIKGGHVPWGDDDAWDYLTDGKESAWLLSQKLPFANVHGTGCMLSAAIAAALAQGYPLWDAVVLARAYVVRGIRASQQVGEGMRHLHHESWAADEQSFPRLVRTLPAPKLSFASCGPEPLGFYPIVDRAVWLARLLPLGVRTIQLRVKDLAGDALTHEIAEAVELARRYEARLFVNDYWELALRLGAYGVHLGQEDLQSADLPAIATAGLRLGVSTHCPTEVAVAHGIRPSYMAVGPIFPTTLKLMPFAPLTPHAIAFWKRIVPYPLVAIGGITLERAAAVWAAGADGIAVVSDICAHAHPEGRAREWLGHATMKGSPSGKVDHETYAAVRV